MSFEALTLRDGSFDVLILAGPRVELWPSVGTRAISTLCAEMGLTTGVFGGDTVSVKGVLPSAGGTGGVALIQDVQGRIHRIRGRAIVRISVETELPDPFPGWRSQGLIPISTALKLFKEDQSRWDPSTVILGTGNGALRFGSALLEAGVGEVICVESFTQWGAKRFAGWEVEKRRFEMAGGKTTEAIPVRLTPKGPLLWELRLKDSQGVRVIEVGRVVSAGPFRDSPAVREHPPGSSLFELVQTSSLTPAEGVEGWVLEEERGRWLGAKIVRALVTDLGDRREDLDRSYRRARGRLKRYLEHRERPFLPSYQGKWVALPDTKKIREFSGTPKGAQIQKPIASIECFEGIPCNLCETACPEGAIQIGKDPILDESKCTSCGICLKACPSGATLMIHERENRSNSELTISVRTLKGLRGQINQKWKAGDFATLLNRRGESLGSGRVLSVDEASESTQLVRLELPSHLVWEARGIRPASSMAGDAQDPLLSVFTLAEDSGEKVEITLNGEKRLVREGIPASTALFEIGHGRPEDLLLCGDGSCGLCHLQIDGTDKSGCQEKIHRGMAIRTSGSSGAAARNPDDSAVCPCLGVTLEQIKERIEHGKLHSPEAILSVLHVGEGRCHGQLCMSAFRRALLDHGIDASQWIDWRLPWMDWSLPHS